MKPSTAVLLFLALAACATDSDATDTAEQSPPDESNSAQPPGPPDDFTPDGEGSASFAMSHVYFGDTTRDGGWSDHAWESFGYDLDQRASTSDSTDVCTPRAGARVVEDGERGIDNAFGKAILPIITGIQSDASSQLNDAIEAGGPTLVVTLDLLGNNPDYSPMGGRMYTSTEQEAPPAFDGSDTFTIAPESLNDTDLGSAKVAFADAYVVGNVLVARPGGMVRVALALEGDVSLDLPVDHAIITMELSADRTHATQGTIAGIIPTEALMEQLRQMAGSFDASLCSGAVIESILEQIEQASDIRADGSQGSGTCDGISIGLGFDASAVTLGAIGAAADPVADACE